MRRAGFHPLRVRRPSSSTTLPPLAPATFPRTRNRRLAVAWLTRRGDRARTTAIVMRVASRAAGAGGGAGGGASAGLAGRPKLATSEPTLVVTYRDRPSELG